MASVRYSLVPHLVKVIKEQTNNTMLQIIFSEHPTACSTKEIDESITYFQIQDKNGNALESGLKEIFFSPNENKDSQFWYLQKQPNSDFGYIGSKLYYDNYRVLSVSSSPCKYDFFNFIRFDAFQGTTSIPIIR